MKHLMTLIALVVAVTAGAQGTTIHEYPWNPDSNNDNLIGVDDLLDFLPVFGDEFGNPPEPCDYDGSSFEDFIAGVWNGDIVIDSIFFEYELRNVVEYFQAGCPDPVIDTVIFTNSFITGTAAWNPVPALNIIFGGDDAYGGYANFRILFNGSNGTYKFRHYSATLNQLGFTSDGTFGIDTGPWSSSFSLPFPDGWSMDENGIHVDDGWYENQWPFYATYMHILPYWHYAE